jgi:hypothetical protein
LSLALRKPYIQPSFEKILFDSERPTIILISAVGASGKTALAENLSRETGLPILDLSKHQPVGANALTDVLTQAFDIQDISTVLGGLATGTFGVIIDGVDEGRSKTTKEAFEAFLDDIIRTVMDSQLEEAREAREAHPGLELANAVSVSKAA